MRERNKGCYRGFLCVTVKRCAIAFPFLNAIVRLVCKLLPRPRVRRLLSAGVSVIPQQAGNAFCEIVLCSR